MRYLSDLGISENTITKLNNLLPYLEHEALEKHSALVTKNINYLKNVGIDNIDLVFSNYYDLFLLDSSKFESIFNKYEASDLADKINKNAEIIEFL